MPYGWEPQDPLAAYFDQRKQNNAQGAANVNAGVQGIAGLGALQKQMQERQLMQALASGDDAALARTPGGLQALIQKAQVQEHLAKAAGAQREQQFFSPENRAQFMTGGAPAVPAQAPATPNDDEGNANPGVPAQPAVPGQLDLAKFAQAGAAQGIKGAEPLLNHLAQRDQAKATMLQNMQIANDKIQKDYDLAAQRGADAKELAQIRLDGQKELRVLAGSIAAAGRREPQPHYITNADGIFQVGANGQAMPVMGPDGKPLTGKTTADKVIPSPIAKAYTENANSLRKIDSALEKVKNFPDSFGLTKALGDTANQRLDPEGVEARAIVADIGSLKIHDRSGAAVTAAETPRLKPFIPNVTDTPETIKKKLGLFRQEYQNIQNDLQGMYGADQGYKSFPGAQTPAAPGAVERSTSKSGKPMHKENGQWVYD